MTTIEEYGLVPISNPGGTEEIQALTGDLGFGFGGTRRKEGIDKRQAGRISNRRYRPASRSVPSFGSSTRALSWGLQIIQAVTCH